MEEWLKFYDLEVSNFGMVRRFIDKSVILPHHDSFGYPSTTVRTEEGKKKKSFRVHRMVALCFLNKKEEQKEVNHIDGNPKNNNYKNLEWCTHQQNILHANRTGLRRTGHNSSLSKLKEHEVIEIIKMNLVYGFSTRLIGELYNISHQHVSDLVNRKRCWYNLKFELTL